MKMSDKGIEWLKGKEDRVLDKRGNHVIYDDATKKPVNPNEPLPKGATIGYGHLVKPGEDFTNGITERQAIALLRSDIATAERAVQDNITAHMSQPQYDALVSLAYNIGASGFKNSTVVKYINNPDFHSSVYSDLESAWKAWNRTQGKVSNGLINRRQNECYGGTGIIYEIQKCPDGGGTRKSPAGISGKAWNTGRIPLVVLS